MAEKKENVYVGYTNAPRVETRISFTTEELETLKQYATAKGRVYIDVLGIPDKEDNRRMKAFCSVYDPNSPSEQQRKLEKQSTNEVPFWMKGKGELRLKPSSVNVIVWRHARQKGLSYCQMPS